MSNNWWFLYQQTGGEDEWLLSLAERREEIALAKKPAFVTVLDLSMIPTDHDWSKVRYQGPLYFDFDADGDLELACQQFTAFLAKLDNDFDFDISQARLYASGGKGFHIEIPEGCFMPKVPVAGTTWLPYVYRAMAEAVVVDTMDMRVYTGKRGRMWRTPNVLRENGNYKVSLSVADALDVTPDSYAELISTPREQQQQMPAFLNSKLAMLFDRSRDKVVQHMRGSKKRREKSNAFLEPWRKSKKTPPTIEKLMSGEIVADGVGFQALSMQLAIYATSVDLELDDFLARCAGLCESHVSDSRRYNTPTKRREELARMFRYMETDSMYEFDTAPLIRLVRPGVPVTDLGVMETEDKGDATPASSSEGDAEDGDTTVATPAGDDALKGVRRGFFLNSQGMFRKIGDIYEPLCRATVRGVESFYDLERQEFKGFEFDVIAPGRKPLRAMLSAEAFTSSISIKKFFAAHQISFQGGDPETMALLDIMAEKASRGGRTFTYPREGFFVIDNPSHDSVEPVKVYLTQDAFIASVAPDDDDYFKLRYRPTQAISSYNIDIHRAPELCDDHKAALHDLFSFTREDVGADTIGWMVACHYRSIYLYLYNQFPLLQVYGEAGAGKSQTVWMLAHLHWYMTDISIKSAASCTPFAMDSHASSSTSAPFILDEFKPRELKAIKGRYEKLKDVLKACYIGADIGERGTINRGAESNLAIIKSKATAPIVFIGEAIEMETAIIERSVCVNLSKSFQTRHRSQAFNRLHSDATALSALGREIVELGFTINIETMRQEFDAIHADIESRMPDFGDETRKRLAPRLIFNRAVIVHALRTLQRVLARRFGTEFDHYIESMINYRKADQTADEAKLVQVLGMSEASKVLSRMAMLSRDQDAPWELRSGRDYLIGDGWLELKVERAYDNYRRFCSSINDSPLFDTMDTFVFAMNSYSPAVDRVCASSPLREEGSNERVVRFDLNRLARDGVKSFRG